MTARKGGRDLRAGAPFADVDIASPEFKRDPYPFFARLRAEMPVCRVPMPGGQSAWLITRYEDVAAALIDQRLAKDPSKALTVEQAGRQPWIPRVFRPLTRNMLDLDAPDHTRLRALVQKAFTPRLVEGLRERIQKLADELLSAASAAGEMDLIRDFALPIPTTIISEMLGVPLADRNRFHRWSRTIVATSPSGIGRFKAIPSVLAFLRFIRKLIRIRRTDPRDDLISALVRAELLRYEGPLMTATERWAREDLPIAGVTVPRGELVYAVLASANRDERQFPDPDVLDIAREPNKHLAFGLGSHYCLGAPLARLEGQIAIATLLRGAPDLRLAVSLDTLRWRRGLVLRGLEKLPVRSAGVRNAK